VRGLFSATQILANRDNYHFQNTQIIIGLLHKLTTDMNSILFWLKKKPKHETFKKYEDKIHKTYILFNNMTSIIYIQK
jgi:hypothetical protein